MNETAIVIRRVLAATPEEVFAAWTDPASVSAWMCPAPGVVSTVVEMNLHVGGEFRIDMRGAQGVMVHVGHYREITPPMRLAFTWRSDVTHNRDTLVTVELAEHPNGVQLILTHTELPDAQSHSAHHGGWSAILESLAQWL